MTEKFMYDKLNERWPGFTYAEDLVKTLREKKVSRTNIEAIAYLAGDVSEMNKAYLAQFHLGRIFNAAPEDAPTVTFSAHNLKDIDRVTAARAIWFIPQALGSAALTPNHKEMEGDYYEGLAFNLMAWARSEPSYAALKALNFDKLEIRAKFSRALYALINGLKQEGVIQEKFNWPTENPSFFWLLCEASMHLSMIETSKEGRADDLERARLMLMAEKQRLPILTEKVQGKEVYTRMYGIIKNHAMEYAENNKAFKRSRWARHNKALSDWLSELEGTSKRNNFLGPVTLAIYGRRRPKPSIKDVPEVQTAMTAE